MKTLSWLAISSSCYIGLSLFSSPIAQSQIVPDTTLSNPSVVRVEGNLQEITGGKQVGDNLFHSFEQFSILTNTEAYFNNNPNIINIFSRVTGNSLSIIDGLIRANGTANLFLLNPSGIVFGPNASLNIGGAFVASTANSIQWTNNQEFSAVNPQDAPPLLTLNVSTGLQYGANPGKIIVQGTGNNLGLNQNSEVIRDFRPPGLEVNSGQSLILAGGEIEIEGGNLTASGGRIELSSVRNGQIDVIHNNGQIQLSSVGKTIEAGNIQLLGAASVDVSGNGGGDVQIQAQNLSLIYGSVILADTLGSNLGGNVIIKTNESVQVQGISQLSPIFSGIFVDTASSATSNGGNLSIETGKLQIADGAQISANTFGIANAGRLNVTANQIEIIGGSEFGSSGLFSAVAPEATGNAGNLLVTTDQISLLDGGLIFVGTFSNGNAGTLNLTARAIEIKGIDSIGFPSTIAANVAPGATGNGGNITITTNSLRLSDGGQLQTSTSGLGNAGILTVKATEIEILGSESVPTGLSTTVNLNATGNGGFLNLETDSLRITSGAQIAVSTAGTGNAGNLSIQANTIELIGASEFGASGLFANAIASTGEGGNISLTTDQLILQDGATINISNFSSRDLNVSPGQGSPGNLTIRANSINLDNQSTITAASVTGSQGNISLSSQTLQLSRNSLITTNISGEGTGGSIAITTNNVTLQNSAITTNASGAGSGGNISLTTGNLALLDNSEISANATGIGSGGNVSLITSSPLLLDQSRITATGGEGNIFIQSRGVELRNGSNLSTNGIGDAPGGNIVIIADYLFAIPQENSDITANAQNSFGGRVIIFTNGIFGLEVRGELTPLSDITVSSQLGAEFGGVIQINNQGLDPRSALIKLPSEVVDATNQIAQGCSAEPGNVFAVTGRGGLPENPNQTLQRQNLWQDLRALPEKPPQPSASSHDISSEPPITEAQGWTIDPDGRVTLIAQTPNQTGLLSSPKVSECRELGTGNRD